jgi:hypothetical protein
MDTRPAETAIHNTTISLNMVFGLRERTFEIKCLTILSHTNSHYSADGVEPSLTTLIIGS